MGIKNLSQLIGDESPSSMKETTIKNYFGRKVAIDASMSLYQFLIAVRPDGGTLTDELGDTTSHLQLFYRTIKMITNGIKPVFVFDGKPPTLKSGELAKRTFRRKEAQDGLEEAKEVGGTEDVIKFTKRTVKVTKQHNDDCKRLLSLMGVPFVEAPCEAEAQCAALCKAGKVWATGTDDMDALTFGTPVLVKRFTSFSDSRKLPIVELHLDDVLEGLHLNMDQFIDLCILLRCDYCDNIRGIGQKRAMELITKYGCLEKILENLDTKKYPIPEHFPYEEVRGLFKHPEVADPETFEFKWGEPDVEGLRKFLVEEKAFNEKRVMDAIEKLKKSKSTSVQGRLDGFFTVTKRKREDEEDSKNKKSKADSGKGKGKGKGKEKEKQKGKGKVATPKKGKK